MIFVNNFFMYFFPLPNGNIYVKKNVSSVAMLDSKGTTKIFNQREKYNFDGIKLPFFRGIAYFILGIYLYIKNLLLLNYASQEKVNKKRTFLLTLYLFLAMLLSFLILVIIPYFCMLALVKNFISYYLACFIISVIRITLFSILLMVLKFIPYFKQIYRHNAGSNLALKNEDSNSFHLPTNYLTFFCIVLYLLFFTLSYTSFGINPILNLFVNLSIIYIIIGVTYEVLFFMEKRENLITLVIIKTFSYFVTEKPSVTEKTVALSCLKEAKLMIENKNREIVIAPDDEILLSATLSEVKDKLNKAGILEASEVDWLVAECLNINRTEMKLKHSITKEQYRKILSVADKRAKHIPLTKIFNRANFYGYNFYIDKNVLSPRPETEILVEEVLSQIKDKNQEKLKILDLCTGSGCIAIILAKKSNAKIFGADISSSALKVANKNAKDFDVKVKFINSDLFKELKKAKFDIIVSNPPYIKSKEILGLDDEVKKFDPILALDGGEDGLYFYREIIRYAPEHLKKNGKIFFEIGYDQAENVKKLLQNNFENITIKKDYSGHDRVVMADIKGKSKNAR